ncbi:MAG: SPOR domain-containing protein [Hyphomicrobium sp.]
MTSQPTHHHTIRKAPLFTPYVLLWTTFGALSLGMLMVLGLAPDWLDDLRPASVIFDPQSNQGQRAAARVAADVNVLKDSVAQIQLDLSKVKTDVVSQGEQQKAVSAQVTSLEARIASAQPAERIEAAAPPADAPAAPTAITAQATTIAKPAAPAPARTPKVINAEASASTGLETGSVTAAAKSSADVISFGPAVVKAAPKPVGVRLSSGASVDSLRLSWSLLAEQHGDALKSLEARYETGGDASNPSYDLVAGPIKSKAEAAKVCKALTAKGVPCTVGPFAGEAL